MLFQQYQISKLRINEINSWSHLLLPFEFIKMYLIIIINTINIINI